VNKNQTFCRFAWATLCYNVGVILWGAWVRITGSGAGCGSHWPTCNGEAIHLPETTATLIEMTHRMTSGITLILAVVLVLWARKIFPRGHSVIKAAFITLGFIILEALLGAGLVLFELVEDNDSVARAVIVGLHLVNTFGLLGFGCLTAWWAQGGNIPAGMRSHPVGSWLALGLFLTVIVGMSGAITALGDTLFPIDPTSPGELVDKLSRDLQPTEHFLVRLRVFHPFLAGGVSLILFCGAFLARKRLPTRSISRLSVLLMALLAMGVVHGLGNIWMAAPGWMQIIHLLLADGIWITQVLFTSEILWASGSGTQAASAISDSGESPLS